MSNSEDLYGPQKEIPESYGETHASASPSPNIEPEKLKRIRELESQNNTRYDEIVFVSGTIKQNVEAIASNLEEIMILRGQEHQIKEISAMIMDVLRKKGVPYNIWHHVPDYLVDPKFKRSYNYSVFNKVQNREDLPVESSIYAEEAKHAVNLLSNLDYRRLDKDSFQEIAEGSIELKQKMESLSRLLKVAIFNSEDDYTGFNRSAITDPYAEKVETPEPEITETLKSSIQIMDETVDYYTDYWQNVMKKEFRHYPPQVLAFAERFRELIYFAVETLDSGVDRKYKETLPKWAGIMLTELEHGKHAAHSKHPIESANCAQCDSEMIVKEEQVTGIEEGEQAKKENTLYTWICSSCGSTKSKIRNVTRERIGDVKEEILKWAEKSIEAFPQYLAWIQWHGEWKRRYLASQTINLSGKLSDRA